MDWTEICLTVNTADCETASAIANMTVPYGIYIEDYSDMEEMLPTIGIVDYIDEDLLQKDRDHAVIHIYIDPAQDPREALSFAEERLRASGIEYTVALASIPEDAFRDAWKQSYKPTRVGERVVICPSWEDYAPAEGDVVINLDPGRAFGTGRHETTRLCLTLAEKAVTEGCTVLDMGCGSGILSIAAMKLGAACADAVDIDPSATMTAFENAMDNGLYPEDYHILSGDVLAGGRVAQKLRAGYDLILANIVADVLLAMVDFFKSKLAEGGTLVASGIIDARREEVIGAFCDAGFNPQEILEDGSWTAVRFTL